MKLTIESAIKPTLCILGGTGFVGHHLANELVEQGYKVRILTRRRERHRELLVLPQIEVIEANVNDTDVLRSHFSGCDAVINLVAVLNENHRGDFKKVHVDLVKNIIQTCMTSGVHRLLHMSALNADAQQGKSQYQRSKGEGEDLVHSAASKGLQVTSFRPSVIFGPNDHFFTRFATLLKTLPVALPLACPDTRFAPVYVGDVIAAFITALKDKATIGQRYDLCGPHIYTLRQLLEYIAVILKINRRIIGLGDGLSRLQARIMQHLPGKPLTYDNYLSMQTDNICHQELPEFFNITPTSIEAVVPFYLKDNSERTSFDEYRGRSRHEY